MKCRCCLLCTYNIHSTKWKLTHPFTLQQPTTSVSLSHKIFMHNFSIVICDTVFACIFCSERNVIEVVAIHPEWHQNKGIHFVQCDSRHWDIRYNGSKSFDFCARLGIRWHLELWYPDRCIHSYRNPFMPQRRIFIEIKIILANWVMTLDHRSQFSENWYYVDCRVLCQLRMVIDFREKV